MTASDPPKTKAAEARDRLAGSGTRRQECLTRQQSAAFHHYLFVGPEQRGRRQPAQSRDHHMDRIAVDVAGTFVLQGLLRSAELRRVLVPAVRRSAGQKE